MISEQLTQKVRQNNGKFGPPHAVLNISKVGLRYFRIFIQASPKSKEILLEYFTRHPNIGWVFSAEGWFNIGIGVWAQSNREINEISTGIRKKLQPKDTIVYQSELTSLYGFGNRPIYKTQKAMTIVDSVHHPSKLSLLEIDYLKILTLDSSISPRLMSDLLGLKPKNLLKIKQKLENQEIIVGYQERINYRGFYYKVFIDSHSRKNEESLENLLEKLWKDTNCIYVERANGKYDLEFEVILNSKSEIKRYVTDFEKYQIAVLTKNLHTNLYPLNKVSNLMQISDTLEKEKGAVYDFRNSKLWYLNYEGADAYLSIYENKKYFEAMEESELDLFRDVIAYIKKANNSLFSFIDIGSGNGLKGRLFIKQMGENSFKAYYAVDIQPIELAVALNSHAKGKYAKHSILLDIENLSSHFPLKLVPGEKQIYGFLGGTYGNFKNKIINAYLKPIINNSSVIFMVTMPIINEDKSEEEIIDSYANLKFEDIAFGPLLQLGFSKRNFQRNKKYSKLYVHINFEKKRLISSFILADDVVRMDRKFKKGSIFKMTSSWKPSLLEFKRALESDFCIDKIFNNDSMCIALIKGKNE